MTKAVEIRAWYPAEPEEVFAAACRFSDMAEAMAGMATYQGIDIDAVAASGQAYVVDVTFFGMFKMAGHHMTVERVDHDERVIQSREWGNGVRRWDHRLSVAQDGALALWTDHVEIDAGWRTPFVARFAAYMYRRRHRHRRAVRLESRIFDC